jgi:hypothetical protein
MTREWIVCELEHKEEQEQLILILAFSLYQKNQQKHPIKSSSLYHPHRAFLFHSRIGLILVMIWAPQFPIHISSLDIFPDNTF